MIYRLYSDYSHNANTASAILSWQKDGIINVPLNDNQFNRNIAGLPFLKDILDKGVQQCKNDDDIIIYTNSDIGLVSNDVTFPKGQFFSVRKQVKQPGVYSTEDLKCISYERSVNCDLFGFTKHWYLENKNKIPDFIIGSPRWDLAFLILLNGQRINNITYHVEHESEWKKQFQHPKHSWNKALFQQFQNKLQLGFNLSGQCMGLFNYMAKNLGYDYLLKPKIITFNTPSHVNLQNLHRKSIEHVYGDSIIVHQITHNTQHCDTADYHQQGWRETQVNKVGSLLDKISRFKDGEIFIFCDADIVHVRDCADEITQLLETYDMVAQKSYAKHISNNQRYCSGFFAAKKNNKILFFLKSILSALKLNIKEERYADQYYFNNFSPIMRCYGLSDEYFSPGAITGKKIESKEQIDQLIKQTPDNIKIAHASWIYGKDNKEYYLSNIIK